MKTLLMKIIKDQNSGNETTVNDTLMFGLGVYAYAEDVIKSGISYIDGLNPVFKHIPETEIEKFLNYLYNRDGYLEF